MRMLDLKCAACDHIFVDFLQRDIDSCLPRCNKCGGEMERVFLPTGRGQVQGDEIDVTIRHGLCNADGSPRRFRSRTELRKAEQKAGMLNYVVHQPPPHSDKSKHTTKWS